MRCRTVDSGVEKLGIAGDNWPQPVGCRWTTSSTAWGSSLCPQTVEIFRPRIHNRLTCSDRLSLAASVDGIWITSQSPGCGRKKVTTSVEEGRNPAGIRTRWLLRPAGAPTPAQVLAPCPAPESGAEGRRTAAPLGCDSRRMNLTIFSRFSYGMFTKQDRPENSRRTGKQK